MEGEEGWHFGERQFLGRKNRPEDPDGLTVNALVDEATNRVAKDREMEGVYPFVKFRNDSPVQPLREYWIGRNQTKTSARRAPMR